MKDLFVMDFQDYNPEGKIFSRPSARAIIIQDGKALLMYSKKYDYYKFPGGGIEKGESHAETLCREVTEESGYVVRPESIEEYGRVLRKQKDSYDENCIFQQENFYYFCDVEEKTTDRNLDDYEEEESFTVVWMDLMEASRHNLYERRNNGGDATLIEREGKVFDIADLEVRKRIRREQEKEFLTQLGNPEYGEMLSFVEEKLSTLDSERSSAKKDIAYSRFAHTKRVLGWAKKLYDLATDQQKIDYDATIVATIFHDVGRNVANQLGIPHAQAGVPITREYLLTHGYDAERTEYICSLVEKHSDKYLMSEADKMDRGLLLLQEADLMDDMGALGIVMDCMIVEAKKEGADFYDALDHIRRYTHRIQKTNPMATPEARKIWDEKTKLVDAFTDALQGDVEW